MLKIFAADKKYPHGKTLLDILVSMKASAHKVTVNKIEKYEVSFIIGNLLSVGELVPFFQC